VETTAEQVIARYSGSDTPDVLLLDFNMPGLSGIDGLRAALRFTDGRPLGLLVADGAAEVADFAMAAGAHCVLPLDMPPLAFHAAISLLQVGQSFTIYDRSAIYERLERATTLSDREIQILRGICKGLQNKEIAHAFHIQEVTVKMHVRSIIRKLGARNRTHAAMLARDLAVV